MNLNQTGELIDKARARVNELVDQQSSSEHFSLPTDDARRHLTSITGVSFDLKQTVNQLADEQEALHKQLKLVDELYEKGSSAFEDARLVTQRLLDNTPPV